MAYCGPRGLPLSDFLSWSAHDQAAALAWQAHEARRCTGCGTHAEDWDESRGGDRHAYRAVLHECEGCVRIAQMTRTDDAKHPGMYIRLTR